MADTEYTREPTSWTHPLQATVAGFFVATTVFFIAQLVIISGTLHDSIATSVQNNPQGMTPSQIPGLINAVFIGFMAVAGIFSALFLVLAAASYFKRWGWVFFVDLALIALICLNNAREVVGALSFHGGYLTSLITAVLAFGLLVWMLIAVSRFGSWGTRRVPVSPNPKQ